MRTLVQQLKALSDENRLRILALLLHGERCVCELMAVLDTPQSTVSRHLAYLRKADWIDGRRQGVWMYYQLAGLSPQQQELLAGLRPQLEVLPAVSADRRRLAQLLQGTLTAARCA